jgi:predicted HAD superfamily Cof-like phosphohydrolase
MADGLADTMVICAGGMAICGIADLPLLREVDDNNLLKLDTGYFDAERGKFIKAKNHPKPDIAKVLKAQGWEDANVHVFGGSYGCPRLPSGDLSAIYTRQRGAGPAGTD